MFVKFVCYENENAYSYIAYFDTITGYQNEVSKIKSKGIQILFVIMGRNYDNLKAV